MDTETLHGSPWWDAFRAGDFAAFARLVEAHQALVCGVAFAALGDRALSEDVAQETFLAAYRQRLEIRDPLHLQGWLAAVARNQARSALRRYRDATPAADVSSEAQAQTESAHEVVLREERTKLLQEALAQVPESYREVLVLYYRDEESAEAVAEKLGLTPAATLQRLHRGRAMLRDRVVAMADWLRETHPRKSFVALVLAFVATRAANVRAEVASPPLRHRSTARSGARRWASSEFFRGTVVVGALLLIGGLIGRPWQAERERRRVPRSESVVLEGSTALASTQQDMQLEPWLRPQAPKSPRPSAPGGPSPRRAGMAAEAGTDATTTPGAGRQLARPGGAAALDASGIRSSAQAISGQDARRPRESMPASTNRATRLSKAAATIHVESPPLAPPSAAPILVSRGTEARRRLPEWDSPYGFLESARMPSGETVVADYRFVTATVRYGLTEHLSVHGGVTLMNGLNNSYPAWGGGIKIGKELRDGLSLAAVAEAGAHRGGLRIGRAYGVLTLVRSRADLSLLAGLYGYDNGVDREATGERYLTPLVGVGGQIALGSVEEVHLSFVSELQAVYRNRELTAVNALRGRLGRLRIDLGSIALPKGDRGALMLPWAAASLAWQ